MGCFNRCGFYSHLPITYDDDIVCFICASHKYKNHETTPIAPFGVLEPICLPIFGKYDDYGSIENIIKDDNVDCIEKAFQLPIEEIFSAIDICSGYTISEINENERLNSNSLKKYTEKYVSILNKLKESFKFHLYDFDTQFSLLFTMELSEVYYFSCRQYYNKKGAELLDSILKLSESYNFGFIDIFDRLINDDCQNDFIEAVKKLDSDKAKKLADRISHYSELRRLVSEYSMYNHFSNCSINSFLVYKIGKFHFQKNIKLINDFSSFCLCLTLNCINFSVSSYGNQSILEQCDLMIDKYNQFIKILKTKKDSY